MRKAFMIVGERYAVHRWYRSEQLDEAVYIEPSTENRQHVIMEWRSGDKAGTREAVALQYVECPWGSKDEVLQYWRAEMELRKENAKTPEFEVAAAYRVARIAGIDTYGDLSKWVVHVDALRTAWESAGLTGDPLEDPLRLGNPDGVVELSFSTFCRWAEAWCMTNPSLVAREVIQYNTFAEQLGLKKVNNKRDQELLNNEKKTTRVMLFWSGRDIEYVDEVAVRLSPDKTYRDKIERLEGEIEELQRALDQALINMSEMGNLAGRIKHNLGDYEPAFESLLPKRP